MSSATKKKQPSQCPLAKDWQDVGGCIFNPRHYEVSQQEAMGIVAQQPLAQLVTASIDDGKTRFRSTVTPLIADSGDDDSRSVKFLGHIAKRNPQSAEIVEGSEVLALIMMADAYISPRWFREELTVPTWNYTSIQIRGEFIPLHCEEQRRRVLDATIFHLEQDRFMGEGDSWSLDLADEELVNRLIGNITAFEIKPDSIEGIQRLAQDKVQSDYESIIQGLGNDRQHGSRRVAEQMRANLDALSHKSN